MVHRLVGIKKLNRRSSLFLKERISSYDWSAPRRVPDPVQEGDRSPAANPQHRDTDNGMSEAEVQGL